MMIATMMMTISTNVNIVIVVGCRIVIVLLEVDILEANVFNQFPLTVKWPFLHP